MLDVKKSATIKMQEKIIALNAGHEPKTLDSLMFGNGCGAGTSTYHGSQKGYYHANSLSIPSGEFKGVINENSFTQDMVERISGFLQREGYQIVFSRPSQEYWVPERYSDNLAYRIDFLNRSGAGLILDIHANGNPDSDKKGFSIIVDNSHPESEKYQRSLNLAELVFREMEELEFRDRRISARAIHQRADLRVIRDTFMPAILIECGYMTNPQDMGLLAMPEYRILLSERIASGVLKYFSKDKN
jgi:N-acetylmuramoyl-L-alanine amidase